MNITISKVADLGLQRQAYSYVWRSFLIPHLQANRLRQTQKSVGFSRSYLTRLRNATSIHIESAEEILEGLYQSQSISANTRKILIELVEAYRDLDDKIKG